MHNKGLYVKEINKSKMAEEGIITLKSPLEGFFDRRLEKEWARKELEVQRAVDEWESERLYAQARCLGMGAARLRPGNYWDYHESERLRSEAGKLADKAWDLSMSNTMDWCFGK